MNLSEPISRLMASAGDFVVGMAAKVASPPASRKGAATPAPSPTPPASPRGGSVTVEYQLPGGVDALRVLSVALDDENFEIWDTEKSALAEFRRSDAAIIAALEAYSEDRIRAAYKLPSAEPREPKEQAVKAASEHRKTLKSQRPGLRTAIAPIVAQILSRALFAAEKVHGELSEIDHSRAERWGIPYTPSVEALALGRAIGILRSRHYEAVKCGDLCEPTVMLSGVVDLSV